MPRYARTIVARGRLRPAAARLAAASVALALACAAPVPPAAQAGEALSDAEKAEIEALIERYIAEHPEAILESVQTFRAREEVQARERAQANLTRLSEQIKFDPAAPVAGNPDGDVTVVEFFDYKCGYCKASLEMVMALIRDDPNVRLVFREFPILTPESARAARAALASARQGKYLEFHYALMSSRGSLDDQQIMDIAAEVGLDLDQLARDMEAPEIQAHIDTNHALARELNIIGTPAFIVEDQMFPGAIEAEVMRRAVADKRAG